MAHKSYTDTNANGVKYALTYENATQSYTLVITYPASDGGSPTTITGIPPSNVLTSDGGTLAITSLVAGSTYVIPPGITGNQYYRLAFKHP